MFLCLKDDQAMCTLRSQQKDETETAHDYIERSTNARLVTHPPLLVNITSCNNKDIDLSRLDHNDKETTQSETKEIEAVELKSFPSSKNGLLSKRSSGKIDCVTLH